MKTKVCVSCSKTNAETHGENQCTICDGYVVKKELTIEEKEKLERKHKRWINSHEYVLNTKESGHES